MDWNRFWYLFHKAWGECHESPVYDKSTWREMQSILEGLEGKEEGKVK